MMTTLAMEREGEITVQSNENLVTIRSGIKSIPEIGKIRGSIVEWGLEIHRTNLSTFLFDVMVRIYCQRYVWFHAIWQRNYAFLFFQSF